MSDICFGSIDHAAEQKFTVYRTKYLSTKSEVKGNPTESQQNVWDHLNNFGLDTIVYLPDPKYRTKAICTVTHHVPNNLITSTSNTFDHTKSKIKIMRPQQYPNQDIDKITAKYLTQAEQLDIAGYFDCSLILNMFLCASRDDEEPHHNMNNLRKIKLKVFNKQLFSYQTKRIKPIDTSHKDYHSMMSTMLLSTITRHSATITFGNQQSC